MDKSNIYDFISCSTCEFVHNLYSYECTACDKDNNRLEGWMLTSDTNKVLKVCFTCESNKNKKNCCLCNKNKNKWELNNIIKTAIQKGRTL